MKFLTNEIKLKAITGQAFRKEAYKITAFFEKKILRPLIAKAGDYSVTLTNSCEDFIKRFSRALKY